MKEALMQFADLHLVEPLLRALHSEGYTEPSPIQSQAIPHILAGRDVLGCAQTGTGKTAAFALPILQHLLGCKPQGAPHVRVLVLSPTRELASQIGQSFNAYGKYTSMRQATIFGGVGQQPQVERLRRNPEVVVATPGRLLDLIQQGHAKLNQVEILVLDEADRMLDMGFINDVRQIIARLPVQRQTLLFSATMPESILALANSILTDPVSVEVTPVASTVDTIEQRIYFVEKSDKAALLQHLLQDGAMKRVLVFTRTKHGANRVAEGLARASLPAEVIHGGKSQGARQRALHNFKVGKARILVATDIAARGIDVDQVTHVVNYDLPNEPESYVHRIGRTGRAGASGVAYSFCDVDERAYLKDIERLIQQHIAKAGEHPYASKLGVPAPSNLAPRGQQARNPGNGRPANPAPRHNAPAPQSYKQHSTPGGQNRRTNRNKRTQTPQP
jgi:ATP-dependent RNA helicase RhlE